MTIFVSRHQVTRPMHRRPRRAVWLCDVTLQIVGRETDKGAETVSREPERSVLAHAGTPAARSARPRLGTRPAFDSKFFVFIYRSQRITTGTLVYQTLSGTHLTTLVLRITCAKACLKDGVPRV